METDPVPQVSATPFFALTFRGVEDVAAGEIAALPGVTIDEIGYRRVRGHVVTAAPLLTLRTVDDVFLSVATWAGLVRQRTALSTLNDLATALRLYSSLAACRSVREVPDAPRFSVTASFVGERNYNIDEIKATMALAIQRTHRWPYVADDAEADLNVRVFIDHDAALVGLRLGARPLHHRTYRVATAPAALKAPVAAVMLRLAGLTPTNAGEGLVLDVCGGSGVIALEAVAVGGRALTGDVGAGALMAAAQNTAASPANVRDRVANVQWDGARLPIRAEAVRWVVSDLPWGKQVQVNDSLAALYRGVCAEIERVLTPDGCAVLLTSTPALVAFNALRPDRQIPISLFGQQPTIVRYRR